MFAADGDAPGEDAASTGRPSIQGRAGGAALRCSACQGKPAPVYLVAGHVRNHTGGPLPSWAMQLVPAP